MFIEVEVANQWHCRVHNNPCPTLHKRTYIFTLFVCDKTCEQLIQEWIERGKRTIEGGVLYICITKCGTVHPLYFVNDHACMLLFYWHLIGHWNETIPNLHINIHLRTTFSCRDQTYAAKFPTVFELRYAIFFIILSTQYLLSNFFYQTHLYIFLFKIECNRFCLKQLLRLMYLYLKSNNWIFIN